MDKFIIFLIKFYQIFSRTFLPRTCRFYPCCSQYTIEAVQKYGFIHGSIKSLIRILRCSPFTGGGYDPLR
ncbi:MAG: membrane protein insertion efficiency factor YidD [Candidatus Omnitrophica bacterium]|nr:membrane protein insertion efficiency factor YidD [Candidatus Omnitrophota bacterium]